MKAFLIKLYLKFFQLQEQMFAHMAVATFDRKQ